MEPTSRTVIVLRAALPRVFRSALSCVDGFGPRQDQPEKWEPLEQWERPRLMIGRDDDRDLVASARRGDPDAYGVLVRRYQDRLYPTLLRLTGRHEDACDLLQETFLRAYLKLDRFQGESSFFTWIYRIGINLALSDMRRRKPPLQLHDPDREARRELAQSVERTDPSRPLEQAERDAQVEKALDSLLPDYRAVVVLKDIDGLRYEEIAQIMKIPVGTVRSRLHRARAELREKLRGVVEESTARTPFGEPG